MLPLPWKDGLTVGQVAGIIGGGISIAHSVIPLLIALVIIAVIQKDQHTAATWTVASQQIQGSLWPFFLRGDASTTKNVRWRVHLSSKIVVFSVIVLFAAHILTPLPLTSELTTSTTLEEIPFQYVPDLSFVGQATLPRLDDAVNRVCSSPYWMNCPDSAYYSPDGYNFLDGFRVVNSTVPRQTSDAFSSGTLGSTVAGPMDIQYRQYYLLSNDYVDGGVTRLVGNSRALQTFMLEESYSVVEGVIVDSINGGIGLRNHTIPMGLELGATWSEDILWIEPVTYCADTQLSFGFRLNFSANNSWGASEGTLTDYGGLADLSPEPPGPSWFVFDGPDALWNQSSSPPDLEGRALQAAWWNNYFTLRALNITESRLGQIFNETFNNYAGFDRGPSAIQISQINGGFFDPGTLANGSAFWDPSNPLPRVNVSDYVSYGWRCGGNFDADPSNPGTPYIRCGYLYAVPEPAEPGQSLLYNWGSLWRQQLYTCASSVKASVKTVEFSTNGTVSLAALNVLNVTPKVYQSNESQPLWGVEKVTGYNISDINLFWGLVSDEYRDDPQIASFQGEELYLPATVSYRYPWSWDDGFAAGNAYTTSWNAIYEFAAVIQGASFRSVPSYSGESNFGLTLRYRELTGTPEGAAKLLNLIWTDFAAFATVGAKNGFESQSTPLASPALGMRAVYKHKRIITYSNLYFAIPAFIAGAIWVFLFFLTLILVCTRQVRWRMLNHYVNQTSMGRPATNALFPPPCEPSAKTKEWAKTAGSKKIDVPSWRRISLRSNAGFRPLSGSDSEMTYRNRSRHQRPFQEPDSTVVDDCFDETTQVASPGYEPLRKLERTSQGSFDRRRSSGTGASRFESLRGVRSPNMALLYGRGQEDGEQLLGSPLL